MTLKNNYTSFERKQKLSMP